jgi:hypothetical protein
MPFLFLMPMMILNGFWQMVEDDACEFLGPAKTGK